MIPLTRAIATLLTVSIMVACGSAPPLRPAPLAEAERARQAGLEAFAAGRYRQAASLFGDAERRYLSIDDARGTAGAAISQAEVHLLLGEPATAAGPVARAAAAVTRVDDERLRERVILLEARLAHLRGDIEATRGHLAALHDAPAPIATQAALLACQIDLAAGRPGCAGELTAADPLTRARIERLRADAARLRNDHARARTHHAQALNIYRANFHRPGIAAVYAESAALAAAEGGDVTTAIDDLHRALYLRLWIHDRMHAIETLDALAMLNISEEDRALYLRWREALEKSARPDWDALLEEVFRKFPRYPEIP